MRLGKFICSRLRNALSRIALIVYLAALCGLNENAWALPGTTNLSLLPGVSATATGADFGASISDAFDGNRDGNFNHGSVYYENAGPPSLFYQIDLGASDYIDRVQLLRRTDTDQNVFGPMSLTIYQDDGTGHPGSVAFTHNYNLSYFGVGHWATTDPGSTAAGGAAGGTFGRFVRLERLDNNYWLTFSEFEVIGAHHALAFTEDNNIAAGKPVTTSSPPGFFSQITSGNDSNIVGDFNDPARPVYHSSAHSIGEYWQVDLGADTQLDHLQLFARGDTDTTFQFKVSVYAPDATTVTGSYIVDNNSVFGGDPGFDHIINTAGISGQFIRVETTSDSYLAFTELRAFSGPGSPFSPGDYNQDGNVDFRDYNLWRQNFDSTMSAADYVTWRKTDSAAGVASASSLSGPSLVPEPTSSVLAGLIGFYFVGIARFRKNRAT